MEHRKRILVKRQTSYIDENDLKKMKNVIYTVDKYMLPPEELLLLDDDSIKKSPNLVEEANRLRKIRDDELKRKKIMEDFENTIVQTQSAMISVMNILTNHNSTNSLIKQTKEKIENAKNSIEQNNSFSFEKESSVDKNLSDLKLDNIINEFLNNDNPSLETEKFTEENISKRSTDDFEFQEDSNIYSENFQDDFENLSFDSVTETQKESPNKTQFKNQSDDFQNSKTQSKTKPLSIHKDHRSRLKNQFISHGLESLSDFQKLELLLYFSIPQKDTNPLAHELINQYGSLKDVFDAEYSSLVSINGIKENTATLIKLVSGLFKHCQLPVYSDFITSVAEAKEFCSKLFENVEIEQFYIICLSKSNKVKKVKLLQSGSADEIMVQIRNVTEFALESKCNRIIVSHNHPFGYGKMSDEDCTFTYSLICSCILNSIDVVDHIIVGMDKTISLASQNILQKLKEKAVNTIHLSHEKLMALSDSADDYKINDR